jgi:hypothetical protein
MEKDKPVSINTFTPSEIDREVITIPSVTVESAAKGLKSPWIATTKTSK